MNIGLVRHFKVKRGYPNRFISGKELMTWIDEYDLSEVEVNEVDIGESEWHYCYSSDLSRAQTTAQTIYDGEIIYLEELREVPLFPFFQNNIRLPLFIHLLFIRIAWLMNHKSQNETKKDLTDRINKVLDQAMQTESNVLIIGHGIVMMFMRKELLKRGFKGPKFKRPLNGLLYLYFKS
ncbi:histidine phosphatase family protein [Bacillus alkalicellulosilyticus]|uniref:histidine phosphatase family protein n=1 Tax=Alkalihalobacterium alkalicellulosilyticum TaxID=1912214 RepID=UPI000997EDD9|nr:histidine phosphatase family protein [Bacillus alkalicellulosilyticus]